MNRIFISYRREDSQGHAVRLYGFLRDRYGEAQVFMDVNTMESGADFIDAIARAVQSADLMLVVIGRGWLDAVDAEGRRRLDEPHDFVRAEIEAALTSNIRVVPILVGGAVMPREGDLPGALAGLNLRQAVVISDPDLQSDLDELGKRLDMIMGRRSGDEDRGHRRSSASSESWLHVVAEKLRPRRLR